MENIIGLGSNSASPSDTIIMRFNNPIYIEPFRNYSTNTIIHNTTIQINEIFYKIYIDPSNLPENFRYRSEFLAAKYEFLIYRDVIKPLLDYNISPHFIRYYTIQEGMSINTYVDVLTNKNPPITNRQILRNLHYMYNMVPNRPPLTSPYVYGQPELDISIANALKLNLIGLMPINPTHTITLQNFISNPQYFNNNVNMTNNTIILMNIIYFQIIQAIYSLYLSKTTHNDLHYGNIWITRRPTMQNITYIIQGITYNIRTNICVRIYDFDRAFSKRLGPNPINQGPGCDQGSQCNELVCFKDFIKIYSYIHRHFTKNLPAYRTIPNILNKNTILFPELDPFCRDDDMCFLRRNVGRGVLTPFLANSYLTWMTSRGLNLENVHTTYLQTIYNKIRTYDTLNAYTFSTPPDFTFTCHSNMFNGEGVFITPVNNCCIDP